MRSADDIRVAFPKDMIEQVKAARRDPGFLTSAELNLFGKGRGHFVVILRDPGEVKERPKSAVKILFEAIRYASEELCADTVGLGSLTASVSGGGRLAVNFVKKAGLPLSVTHGDTGSVVSILDCLDMTEPRPDHRIAVVGAYGIIGAALSRILCRRGCAVTLIGRNREKLAKLSESITSNDGRCPRTSTEMSGAKDADRIITVTSSATALLMPDMVKPGAIVIDPAVPANVADDPGWRENGNIVITNASQVRLPDVGGLSSDSIGTKDDPDGCPVGYACLTETMVNAVVGDNDHHVDEVDVDFVETVRSRFDELGLSHATPRMFGESCLSV
jgi:predicted amino acid dehydrogenase